MIRGKIIEESIRFYFENRINNISISSAENYANDLYYLKTRKLPEKIIKLSSQPINVIVRTGIKAFKSLMIRKILNLKSYKIKKNKSYKTIYPDFNISKLNINNKNLRDCCLELKVTNRIRTSAIKRHAAQCYNYSIKSGKPVILLYLVYSKIGQKHPFFTAKPMFYIVNNN